MSVKKVQLEVWTSFEKLCLMSAITKLKTSFSDQNWVTISRYTKQIYESVSACIDFEKRNDDWFTPKQCAAQYESLVKGCGTRRKKKIDRNADYSDIHEALLLAYTQEFCEELLKSMGEIKDDYCRTKKFVEEIDCDKNEDKFEDLILEMLEQEKATDVKSKLKSMLDEKYAECESSSKSQIQQVMMSSTPSTSGEQRTSNTCSPLLTSLLQSPSRLLRQSPSTSSPTISSLLHSSPSVSLTDSTLTKILDSPADLSKTTTVTSLEASSVISQPICPGSQPSSSDTKTKYSSPEGAKVIVERIVQETGEQEIFDDMSDIEQGVVENEIIIENESSPIKRFTPRRLDLEQVEDEEPEEEILETVEEIMERVEEAIIETVGEGVIHDIDSSEPIETVSISDDEIETINIEDNTYEVIVVGSQEVSDQLNSSMSDDCVIIEESIADVDKTKDHNSHNKEVKTTTIPPLNAEDLNSSVCDHSVIIETSTDEVDKTKENDSHNNLVKSSMISPLNDEVENEDIIPKRSVPLQNSETFKGNSPIKIVMNDEISAKESGLEKTKMKIDSEKLLKVNSVEKLDEEGLGELVTQEEITSSKKTIDEKCSVEDNKSEADRGTLLSAEQNFSASSNHKAEGDKQDDSIKASEDNGNMFFKHDSEMCIGINKEDKINQCKQSSNDLPVDEIVSDNISTDESRISKQRIEINDQEKLKKPKDSPVEAQFHKNKVSELNTDITNKNSEDEFLSKQIESHVECLQNKDNDVLQNKENDVLQNKENDVLQNKENYVLQNKENDVVTNKENDILKSKENGVLQNKENDVLQNKENDVLQNKENDVLQNKENDVLQNKENDVLQNKENDVISKSNEKVFQFDTEHPTITEEKALIVGTKETESVIEQDNIIESEQKLIMKHVSDQLMQNEKKITDKVILSTNVEGKYEDKSVNELKKMCDVSKREVSDESVVATKVLELPKNLDEAMEQDKTSENISHEDKSKQVGSEEMESLGRKVCHSVKSISSANNNEMAGSDLVIVDNIAPELTAGSLATNYVTDTIISGSLTTKAPIVSVVPEPVTESVATEAPTDTDVAPLATESVTSISVIDSIVSEPVVTRGVTETIETDSKGLSDTALPMQTVESNAIKPVTFSCVPAMKDLGDTVIPEHTVQLNSTNSHVDSLAAATVVNKPLVKINRKRKKKMVRSISPKPAVGPIAAKDKVDLELSEEALEEIRIKRGMDNIHPDLLVEPYLPKDDRISVTSVIKKVMDSIILETMVRKAKNRNCPSISFSNVGMHPDYVKLNSTRPIIDTTIPRPEFAPVSTKAQMNSAVTTVSDIVDSTIPKPAAELNSPKSLISSIVPKAKKRLVSSVVPESGAELNSTKAVVDSIVAKPTAKVIATKDKVSNDEKIKVNQRSANKKINDNVQEVYHEKEETQESVEHSDKLDETDEEDSDIKDKSVSADESEDSSLTSSDDSTDDHEDSLKFSSLETLSNHSFDSPPESYYNDPRLANLRKKELELRTLMRKGFEEIKIKGAELVLSVIEDDDEEEKKRSKKKRKKKEKKEKKKSKQSLKREKPTKRKNKPKFSRDKKVKTKNIPEKTKWEKVKENTVKDKPSKAKVNKEKPSAGKFLKLGKKAKHLSSVDSKPDSPSLSTASSDEDRDYRSWKKSILLVYNRLASHKYASVFSKPITENEAPSYHQIILRPMDLSTIKRNIENGIIRTTVEFQRDMLLMVQNAIIYNKCDTPVYDMAKVMGEDMLAQMEVMVQALGDGVPLIGDIGEEKQITRARTSKSSNDAPQSKKRKYQESSSDEIRPKRNKYNLSASS